MELIHLRSGSGVATETTVLGWKDE